MSKNYYEILGINKNATADEIKKSFRSKSLVMHPDRGGNENDFKQLNEAYQTLINDDRRREYDFKLEHGNNPQNHFHMPHPGMFNQFFSAMFGGGNPNNQPPVIRKLDVTVNHTPSIEELLKGEYQIKVNINNYNDNSLCGSCNGDGIKIINLNAFARMQQTCTSCNGACITNDGVDEKSEVVYSVPILNIQNTLILKDKGNKCKDKKGNLIVNLDFGDKIDRQGRLIIQLDLDWKEWLIGFRNRTVPLFGDYNMTLNTDSLLGKTELEFAEKGIGCINTYFNNKGILLLKLVNKPLENDKLEKLEGIIRDVQL